MKTIHYKPVYCNPEMENLLKGILYGQLNYLR